MADDRGSASHILPDGTFVNLPKPTQRERANFFARSIANYKLISARQDNDNGVKVEGEEEGGGGGIAGKKENVNGDKEQKGADYVHPLAVASARLQGVGVAELSKAVNLSSLVGTSSNHDEGCYFTLANVIDDDAAALAAAATHRREMDVRKNSGDDKDSAAISDSKKDEVSANAGNNDGGAANFSNKTVEDATRKLKQDRKLRAQYLLKRKRLSYAKTISASDKKKSPWSAADVLELHAKRLKSQLKRQRVVDRRLLDLRKKWKLSLPDHGTRVVAPARPQEIVAVDLKVYSSLTQHDSLDVTPSNVYLLRHEQELQRRQQQANSIEATTAMNKMVPYYATIELDDEIDAATVEALLLSRKNCKNQADNMGSNSVQPVDALDQKRKKDISKATRAEPLYTSSQISSRAVSSNEDITTSQQLTLLVCIEKESTGFSKSVRLLTEKLDDDDMSIVSLQHSLFCSSLFDCIRTEIARESKVSEHDTILSASKLSTKTAISWLPNNMEESFLPPPSMMAANGSFCVIHSQEGEVKVRLNSEYSLIFKLIEIGAAMEFCAKESEGKNVDSGSCNASLLESLGRMLLLHSQLEYHDFSTRVQTEKTSSNVLESCVKLAGKVLLETSVRKSLTKIKNLDLFRNKVKIEWLALSAFETCAHFTVFVDTGVSFDGIIECSRIKVSTCDENGNIKMVTFSTSLELEQFLLFSLEMK